MGAISVTYTNWKGETRKREIIPNQVFFGSTDFHKEPQWLLKATDPEDGKVKDFALKDCDFREFPPTTL